MSTGSRSLAVIVVAVLALGAASQWWNARERAELGPRLARVAQPGDIRVVSSDNCVYCDAARAWLREHRVAHDECFIERDADCRALYQASGARGTPTVLVRGRAQLGFDAARVLQALSG